MTMAKFNPYKGIPRSEWASKKAELDAAKQAIESKPMPTPEATPNVFAPVSPVATEVSAPPPLRINSEPEVTTHIPRNLFDGHLKTLDVMGKNGSSEDPIPGYRLYWFNDVGVRLKQAEQSGWAFVTNDEVLLSENLVGNNDLGSKISKVVNPNVTPPQYAYLMKKPQWLNDTHMAERERIHQRQDEALRAGTLGRKPEDRQYAPQEMRGQTSLPPIDISSNVFRGK